MAFKFLDRVVNKAASADNPCKHGLFIEYKDYGRRRLNGGKWARYRYGDGKFAETREENLDLFREPGHDWEPLPPDYKGLMPARRKCLACGMTWGQWHARGYGAGCNGSSSREVP